MARTGKTADDALADLVAAGRRDGREVHHVAADVLSGGVLRRPARLAGLLERR
jgi:hypothetical protein